MDKKEQTQLQQNTAEIKQLKTVVSVLIRRIAILEREVVKNRSALARSKADVYTLEQKVSSLPRRT